jgi:hypothetical protein
MKGLLLFLLAFVFCVTGSSQKPESFNYQAVVRNSAGVIVDTKPVSVRLSVLAGSASGTTVYKEVQSATTNNVGLISLSIGNGTEKTGNFTSIDWNANKYFLKIEIDPAGGSSFDEMSIIQLLNIPFETLKKSSKRESEFIIEDEFLVTRKFIGEFMDYRHTGQENYDGPNLLWIKTSMEKTYGKLSAYGKTCNFIAGENIYIRRIFYSPGDVTGYWMYQIENDSSTFYRLSEFQYDKKAYIETLFSY